MSKILKANRIRVDSDDKLSIAVPVFEPAKKEKKDEKKSFQKVNHEISFEDFDELSLTDELDDFDELSLNSEGEINEDVYENAEAEAQKIIEKAREDAQNILDDALFQAESQKEEIFNQARQEGYNEGVAEAEAETADIKAEAHRVLEDAETEKERMLSAAEGEMVDVIVNSLNKLMGKTIDLDRSIISNVIRQGFAQSTVMEDVFVRVSENDYEYVIENKDEIFNFVDSNTKIEIVKDISLVKGDCLIETPFGDIDCGLSQKFEGLKKSLYYILENG